jgi:hypothetical protein
MVSRFSGNASTIAVLFEHYRSALMHPHITTCAQDPSLKNRRTAGSGMNELYSIEPRVLFMIRAELEAALRHLRLLHAAWQRDPSFAEDNRRIAAAIVLIEEVDRQTSVVGYKPREMLPFLQCAIYFMGFIGGAELGPAREHASAACELLSPD